MPNPLCKTWRSLTSADASAVCEGELFELLRDLERVGDYFSAIYNASVPVFYEVTENFWGAGVGDWPGDYKISAFTGAAVAPRAISVIRGIGTPSFVPLGELWLDDPTFVTEGQADILVPVRPDVILDPGVALATCAAALRSFSRKLARKINDQDCCRRVRRHEFQQAAPRFRGIKHGQFRTGGVKPKGS